MIIHVVISLSVHLGSFPLGAENVRMTNIHQAWELTVINDSNIKQDAPFPKPSRMQETGTMLV